MRSGASRLRSNVVAAVLVAPALFLFVASMLEASDSPMRFDSTYTPGSVNLTYWSVSINCLVVAILPAITAVWTATSVWKQTRHLFSLNPFLLAAGVFGLLAMAVTLYGLSQKNVDSRFYYYGLFSGTTGSVAATIFASLVFGLCVLGFGVIYSSGIVPQGSGKYDRRPDEPDPLGQMIGERLQERSQNS